MRNSVFLVSCVAALGFAAAAQAQDAAPAGTSTDISANGTAFRGFRAEVQAGGDRFMSQGQHDDKFAFGGAIGFDGQIGEKIVVGPEVSYWRSRAENVTNPLGGTYAQKSFGEIGAGIRAGYLVQPQILVYGIGGYVSDKQRAAFTGPNNSGTAGAFYNVVHTSGYQVGLGSEYSLNDNVYVGAGYRYSNYADHTARQRVFLSAGVRFKP
ncbi:outer membrane beta-barrel protein [Sphingomonas sp. BIUV-7]|uniref:Outer membrane beta-barrel protein n=1 Tax=Sphingomonas natans TaxID=3063330 RepID=A0ABT8Y4D4_9SPHN|nr:outer membrane beta-barrel protein [Sphingomonas sp. BIUV-7]MDO6413182.1 outer membrane beta-barrel protein [Sphingomonas sp. BIUV-7]